MSEIVTEQQTPQSETVSTNWDAITKDLSEKPLTQEKPIAEENVEEKPIIEPVKTEEKPVIELTPEEKLKETEALKVEAKELGLPETATKEEIVALREEKARVEKPITEFKADDILKEITPAPEGTWLRVAQDAKLEGVTEDSFDAVAKAIAAPFIKQIEELKTSQKVDAFSNLKNPETVAALKLLEMGVPEENLFAATRDINNYLSLDNAALVRANLEAMEWKPEMIDAEMELLISKNLIDHEAEKLRLGLNEDKTQIINQRNQLVKDFEIQREQATLFQKQQEDVQFKEALTTVSKFMDVPVTDGIKEAIFKKYSSGGYDKDLNTANSKLQLILYKELGEQYIKALKNTAFENGRDKITKKLLNVPPVTNSNVGQAVDTTNQLKNNDNWAAFERDHAK